MKLRVLQEITDWSEAEYAVPNHTYLVNESKEFCYGYIKQGASEPEMFSKRIPFSTSYRKFKEIK